MKIGVDVGGSHIGIGLVNESGNIIQKAEKFLEDKTDIKEIIEEFIAENVMQMSLVNNVERIGIAIPGTVSENKIIKAVNLVIENYDLGSRLKEILHMEVKLKNDAKCAALAEQNMENLHHIKTAYFYG